MSGWTTFARSVTLISGSRDGTAATLFTATPWQGEPRVNIQSRRGMAKPYQVRRVLRAIDKLEEME